MTDIPEDVMKLARKMREGLEGVTPGFGRWIHLFGERTVYTRDPSDGCRIMAVVRADVPGDNATLDHIARCGPDNIRSLLDTIDTLTADRAAQAERMARMDEKALIMAEVSWAENRREAISPKEMGWLREAIEAYLADIAARTLSQEGS